MSQQENYSIWKITLLSGNMTRLSEKEKVFLKYQIYSYRYENPWISNKKVAKLLHRSISTVNRYAQQAEQTGQFWGPTLGLFHPERKVALLLFKDKWKVFKHLREHPSINYVCVCQGDWDIMTIHDGPVDFSQIAGYKGKIMERAREQVFTPKVTFTSWEPCFEKMEAFLTQTEDLQKSTFNPKSHHPEWDEEEWEMFYYFRSNLRKNFSTLRKKRPISWRKYKEWKDSLEKYCTIVIEYYPKGYLQYDSITFCFRTDYEQYIVELLSNLPTTFFVYKTEEYLLTNLFMSQDYKHQTRFYEIISHLLDQGIVAECMDAHNIVYYAPSEKENE